MAKSPTNNPPLRSVKTPTMYSQKRFLEYADKRIGNDPESEYQVFKIHDGEAIPVDLEDVVDNPGEYELRKGREVIIGTVALGPKQPNRQVGSFMDAASISATGSVKSSGQVLESMLHNNAMTHTHLKEERAQSLKYREDADRYREENLTLRARIIDLERQVADKDDGGNDMMQIVSMGVQAWQSADFRKALIERTQAALHHVSEDEQEIIRRFLGRPEFSSSWGIQVPTTDAPKLPH